MNEVLTVMLYHFNILGHDRPNHGRFPYAFQWVAEEVEESGPVSGFPTNASAVQPCSGHGRADTKGSGTTSAAKFHVYRDPSGGTADKGRLQEARGLLSGVGTTYVETEGSATLDRLAGVTNLVLPRFFLGDPSRARWTPQPKTNNGGLWLLKKKLKEPGL